MARLPFTIVGAVALAACSVAEGKQGGWTPVSFGGSPRAEQLFFVEPSSIVRTAGGIAEFRAMIVTRTPSERGVDNYIERTRADCADRSSRALDQLALTGTTVKYRRGEQSVSERFEPSTPWRILLDSVCSGDLPDLVVADPRAYARSYFSR